MVTLIRSCGEALIKLYEISHSINDFSNNLKLENISVVVKSTDIYRRFVKWFVLEINFKVYIINVYIKKCTKKLEKNKNK